MNKLLIVLLCFCVMQAHGQFVPQQSAQYKHLASDTLYDFTGSGVPTVHPNSYKRVVTYFDSSNSIPYWHNPKTQTWVTISGGAGSHNADSLGGFPANNYERVINKKTSITNSTTDYPTTGAVFSALSAKQNLLTTGISTQYFRGDLSLAAFPTALSSFANDVGYITRYNLPYNGNSSYYLGGDTLLHTFPSFEPSITAGTTAQYFRGDKTFQTLNTAVVPESVNLYYTDARARNSISVTGNGTYNSTTGVINITGGTGGGLANFYLKDSTLSGNRIVNGGSHSLSFNSLSDFVLGSTNGLTYTKLTTRPATPSIGFVNFYFDSLSRESYVNANGYNRTWSMPYPGDQLWRTPYKINGGTLADSSSTITINGNTQTIGSNPSFTISAGSTGVTSFNTRTGAVTPQAGDYSAITETLTNKTLTSPVLNVGSDATGDMYYRNSSGLLTRLPAGSNNQVISIAGGIPTYTSLGLTDTLTHYVYKNFVGAGYQDAIVLADTTAGTSTTYSNAPSLVWTGRGYSGGASYPVYFRQNLTTGTSGQLIFNWQTATGTAANPTYTNVLTYNGGAGTPWSFNGSISTTGAVNTSTVTTGAGTTLSMASAGSGTTTAIINTKLFSNTITSTLGTSIGVLFGPTYNEASGAVPNYDLMVDRRETALSTGGQFLIDAGTNSGTPGTIATHTSLFNVTNKGLVFIANYVGTPPTPTGGGYVYVQGGSLKYIGSSGGVTTLGAP